MRILYWLTVIHMTIYHNYVLMAESCWSYNYHLSNHNSEKLIYCRWQIRHCIFSDVPKLIRNKWEEKEKHILSKFWSFWLHIIMIYAFENICQINVTTIVPIPCDDQLININMYINLSLTSTHALSWIIWNTYVTIILAKLRPRQNTGYDYLPSNNFKPLLGA